MKISYTNIKEIRGSKENFPVGIFVKFTEDMFVRMLTVHCDQNNSYEITING